MVREGISMFSLFFSFGIMGQGALILSGILDLSLLAPVKVIEVSRASMTLETKGVTSRPMQLSRNALHAHHTDADDILLK